MAGGAGGEGAGEGAPIEESNIEDDKGEMGMSRSAVGMGLLTSTGDGTPEFHLITRTSFLNLVAGERSYSADPSYRTGRVTVHPIIPAPPKTRFFTPLKSN